jgi:16S rRNA (cytidine1402-2'-O)-methyltransferase
VKTLYIVATPIGNLEDITLRAIRILLAVPVIACEDTRRTGILLKQLEDQYGQSERRYISVRDWNEEKQVERIIRELSDNDVALVSDAGTPLLSDPGYKLVRMAIEAGVKVVPIPGAFAAAAALSAAGLPTDKFTFWGFLRKKQIPELERGVTHVFYESPERIAETIKMLKEKYPEADAVVAKELTKIHEEFLRGPEIKQLLDGPVKGELVLMLRLDVHDQISSADI